MKFLWYTLVENVCNNTPSFWDFRYLKVNCNCSVKHKLNCRCLFGNWPRNNRHAIVETSDRFFLTGLLQRNVKSSRLEVFLSLLHFFWFASQWKGCRIWGKKSSFLELFWDFRYLKVNCNRSVKHKHDCRRLFGKLSRNNRHPMVETSERFFQWGCYNEMLKAVD